MHAELLLYLLPLETVPGTGVSPLSQKGEVSYTSAESVVPHTEPWRWEDSQDAVLAYGAFAFVLALGALPAYNHLKFAELPYFVGLAASTIYIGAHRGLSAKHRQQLSFKQVCFVINTDPFSSWSMSPCVGTDITMT